MQGPRFSEDVQPITALKTGASSLVRQAARTRRPILLTRRGRGVAVLLDLSEYERLIEQVELQEAVEVGVRAAEAGDLHDQEEAEAILDTFGRSDG